MLGKQGAEQRSVEAWAGSREKGQMELSDQYGNTVSCKEKVTGFCAAERDTALHHIVYKALQETSGRFQTQRNDPWVRRRRC